MKDTNTGHDMWAHDDNLLSNFESIGKSKLVRSVPLYSLFQSLDDSLYEVFNKT